MTTLASMPEKADLLAISTRGGYRALALVLRLFRFLLWLIEKLREGEQENEKANFATTKRTLQIQASGLPDSAIGGFETFPFG